MVFFSKKRKTTLSVAALAFLIGFASVFPPAIAGSGYKEQLDRFTGIKTASYDASLNSECKLLKALIGSLYSCFFMHSTESAFYPGLVIGKKSKGWDLLSYKNSTDSVPAIAILDDGSERRLDLPVSLDTDTLHGGTVSEVVIVSLRSIRSLLPRIKQLDIQYGSSEFAWIPDKALVKKALDFTGS